MHNIIEKNCTEYWDYRIPGLVLTEKGTLLAYYECRTESSDWAKIDLKIIRSTDNGDTWETVKVIPGEGNTLNNPVMIVQGETVHFLYCKNYKTLLYCRSTDDGMNFTEGEQKELTCDFPYSVMAVGPGHGIVHNGNLLTPVWFAYNEEDPYAHHPSFISTIYSEDDGAHWKVGELIGKDLFLNPSECALAITADNQVLNSIRNETRCFRRGLGISQDGYSNWENVRFADNMPDPVCQGSMACDGEWIYHSNCTSLQGRKDLAIKYSKDKFDTFEMILIDEEGGYSDIAISQEFIFIFYERRVTDAGLHFRRIPREEKHEV